MFQIVSEIFKMEVCVDSVQSALNAERGGECLHFQRLSEFNFADSSGRKEVSSCCMLHAVPERIFSE